MNWEACFTRPKPSWAASQDAVQLEIQRLKEIQFFKFETHCLQNGILTVVGVLWRFLDHGGMERLRVRLEYPPNFPVLEPFVFDHDRVFQPSRDGHQFEDYRLCLKFPDRDVFSHDADFVTIEVLGAAWNWMVKRNIFQRHPLWPDTAERHGFSEPYKELALEQAEESKSGFLPVWAEWAIANRRLPRLNGQCPCLSGRALGKCHPKMAYLVERAIHAAILEGV
jgi:hypothetical protein